MSSRRVQGKPSNCNRSTTVSDKIATLVTYKKGEKLLLNIIYMQRKFFFFLKMPIKSILLNGHNLVALGEMEWWCL